ncbi:hypothetical protein COV93_07790 [Candidatus Woesearchaeota archaeon CG11_big_fil_rev_8_21_14_0_20_43_8]|nr:MAG: hypothetical protein COV93_07790 [Candidatus Woesearchaeota archaeon CG11_big_fil_rev_8_21_14_0_20_43_8]PIO04718.1 MAG: hypothetical protein COT47_07890 [Candidatus Woesearchaeota archaeon CG08_land_8_20_14_0_20_43_7]
MNEYFMINNDNFQKMDLREIAVYKKENPEDKLWSARLSTGLFGHTFCPAGNRGPKKIDEVLLAAGNNGLDRLILYGFIPCPVCKPETTEGFWDKSKNMIKQIYRNINSPEEFADKSILPFDALWIDWENIIPHIGSFPSRLYIPQGLDKKSLKAAKKRLKKINKQIPALGYYDANAPGRFNEYKI